LGQEQVIELLNRGKPLSRAEIQEMTDLCKAAVSIALKQLLKYHEIEIDKSLGIPVYKPIIKRKKKKRKKRFLSSSSKNN